MTSRHQLGGATHHYVHGVRDPTPNDFRIAGSRACQGWWISNNGGLALPYGAVTLDEASVDPNPDNWSSNNEVTVTGSGPYAVRATTANARHRCFDTLTADAASISDARLVCSAAGSQVWIRFAVRGDWVNINLSTGAEGNSGGIITATITKVGATVTIAIACRTTGLDPNIQIELLDGDDAGVPAGYVGDVGDGINVTSVEFIQPRASVVTDESLTAAGANRNAHLQQSTDANQPLFYTGFASFNGLPVVFGEDGRASIMTTAHADPAALATGDDPNCAIMGVMSAESGAQLFRWDGAGGEYQYLERNGNDLRLVRHDGASSDTQTWSGVGAYLNTPQLVEVFGIGSRIWSVYTGGTYRGNITMADLSSATMTTFTAPKATGTGDIVLAEIAAFSDLTSLGSRAAIHSALLNQAGGSAMKARWGV